MDLNAVDRIIEAAGSKLYCETKARADLGRELDWAGTWCRTIHALQHETARRKRLTSVSTAAKRLQDGLNRFEDGDLPSKPPTTELEQLAQQVEAALTQPAAEPDWAPKAASRIAGELHLNKRSAFEWLVGVELPRIFKDFFKRQAGFSRGTAEEAGGPYVRFAKQVLVELRITNRGEPYRAEAIAQALADARKGRSRRAQGKAG